MALRFNGGAGAITCDNQDCRIIFKEPATENDRGPLGDRCGQHRVWLSTDDACRMIDLLISMIPSAKERGVQFAMIEAIRLWPDTAWRKVIDRLRSEGTWKIADWLTERLTKEEERHARLRDGK